MKNIHIRPQTVGFLVSDKRLVDIADFVGDITPPPREAKLSTVDLNGPKLRVTATDGRGQLTSIDFSPFIGPGVAAIISTDSLMGGSFSVENDPDLWRILTPLNYKGSMKAETVQGCFNVISVYAGISHEVSTRNLMRMIANCDPMPSDIIFGMTKGAAAPIAAILNALLPKSNLLLKSWEIIE